MQFLTTLGKIAYDEAVYEWITIDDIENHIEFVRIEVLEFNSGNLRVKYGVIVMTKYSHYPAGHDKKSQYYSKRDKKVVNVLRVKVK